MIKCVFEPAASEGVMMDETKEVKNTKFECDHCGKVFSKKGAFNQHRLIHTGVKDFECEYCEKKFRHKGTLKRHMLIHT